MASVSFAASCLPGLTDNTVITNTAVIADAAGRQSERSAETLYSAADLSQSHVDAAPASIKVGATTTITVMLANGGGGPTAFVVTDTLPLGLSFVSGTLDVGHGVASYDAANQRVLWSGDIPGHYATYLRFQARGDSNGSLVTVAQIQDNSGIIILRDAAVSVGTPISRPYKLTLPIIVVGE